jgi:hypothetical protein
VRHSWVTLALLFVVVAALGLFVYLKPHEAQRQEYRLSSLKLDDARSVRIEHRGKPVIQLAREGAQWRMVTPFAARADTVLVQRVLTILSAAANTRFPASALERFDLNAPRATVTINDQTFAFGAASAVTSELYVRAGDWVYPVAARYLGSVPLEASAFVSRRLFGSDEIPVRFRFPQFSVAAQQGRWTVTPASADLSQDDIARWADNWRQASALRVERNDAPRPAKHIVIEFKDGREVSLGVEETGAELAFTRFDEHLRYFLFPSVARVMLAPPQGEPLGKEKRQ